MQAKSTGFACSGEVITQFHTSGFALKGEFIFFVPPKKTNQKKSGPVVCPAAHLRCVAGFPALLEKTCARPTRRSRYARFGLEQGARLFRFFLRCSAAPTGPKPATPIPWAKPSIAGILRASEPVCRAGFASRRRGKCCEFGERSKYREAQGTRAAGKPSGGILFGYFLLAAQEKVPRPKRAKHANKKVDAPRPKGAKHVLQKQTKPAPKGQNTEPKKARHQGRALLPRWRRTGCYLRAPGPLISRPLLM